VTDGIEAALEQARAAAGDKDVSIWGGANIMRQYLTAGLLDELQIHLVPVLLGEGGPPLRGPGLAADQAGENSNDRHAERDASSIHGPQVRCDHGLLGRPD
jgi:dihydrofolate reductase